MPRAASTPKQRIVVGLSGGVDSAVTAWLLQRAGHEVVGLFMKNWEDDDDDEYCSTRQDFLDAASVADVLGHRDRARQLRRRSTEDRVFAEFLREHAGRPHAQPRRAVQRRDQVQGLPRSRDAARRREHRHRPLRPRARSAPLRTMRRRLGFELLKRTRCPGKDQSYFLHRLNQTQLAQTMFPVGELHKTEVRRIADGDQACPTRRKKRLDRHLLHRRAARSANS